MIEVVGHRDGERRGKGSGEEGVARVETEEIVVG